MTENYANNLQEQQVWCEALQWHLDQGADEVLVDTPIDRTVAPDIQQLIAKTPSLKIRPQQAQENALPDMIGAAAAIVEAQKLSAACETLEDLKIAIAGFEGLSLKKTATNMVFGDGNVQAPIMLIGEAPGAEEDVQGQPFVGASGQLLDKILAAIGLDRHSEDVLKSVYVANILNWRPPGNRTATQAEMDISLAFIERHIALVQPKMIILCGGVVAKTLLKRSEPISKMRGVFHDYKGGEALSIPAMVTYRPVYLLRTPAQKKAVWADMLMFQAKMSEIIKK